MQTRQCPKCGKVYPLSGFNKNRRTCKYCDRKVARKHREKALAVRRDLITDYLGKECVVCGEKRMKLMRSHEKYGNKHPRLQDTPVEDVKKNCESGRFVRVCARCHGKTHALLEKGIKWESAKQYIKEFMDSDPPIGKDAHQYAWHKWVENNIRYRQLKLPVEIEAFPKKETTVVSQIERELILSDEEAEEAFAGSTAITCD